MTMIQVLVVITVETLSNGHDNNSVISVNSVNGSDNNRWEYYKHRDNDSNIIHCAYENEKDKNIPHPHPIPPPPNLMHQQRGIVESEQRVVPHKEHPPLGLHPSIQAHTPPFRHTSRGWGWGGGGGTWEANRGRLWAPLTKGDVSTCAG